MKRSALALTVAIVATFAFLVAVAYDGAPNHPFQGENSLSTITPSPSPPSTTGATFDGLGVFGITSPANTTYNPNVLTLSVGGQVIIGSNIYLTMKYSLDGKETRPLPVTVQTRNGSLVGSITGSVTLPQLSDGAHNVTVFANLEANGSHTAQETAYFTVQNSSYPKTVV